jgi:hypothetical protein
MRRLSPATIEGSLRTECLIQCRNFWSRGDVYRGRAVCIAGRASAGSSLHVATPSMMIVLGKVPHSRCSTDLRLHTRINRSERIRDPDYPKGASGQAPAHCQVDADLARTMAGTVIEPRPDDPTSRSVRDTCCPGGRLGVAAFRRRWVAVFVRPIGTRAGPQQERRGDSDPLCGADHSGVHLAS